MKEMINCLQEFEGLKEAERSPYLYTHGDAITDNALVFPLIPHNGVAVLASSVQLGKDFALRHKSDANMNTYETTLADCIKMMNENYDYIDLVAQGDGSIVAKAGVRGTSVNTSRTSPPFKPANAHFEFATNAGEIHICRDVDKLSTVSVTISYVNSKISVVKSGNNQIKITTVDGDSIFVDLATTIKSTIQNQKEGTKLITALGLFNPNGLSPLASPESVVVPR